MGKWSKWASRTAVEVTIIAGTAIIERPTKKFPHGKEVGSVDDSDAEAFCEAFEEGLKSEFADKDMPWFLGAAFAGGSMFLGMYRGAKPRKMTEGQVIASTTTRVDPQPDNVRPIVHPSNVPPPIKRRDDE